MGIFSYFKDFSVSDLIALNESCQITSKCAFLMYLMPNEIFDLLLTNSTYLSRVLLFNDYNDERPLLFPLLY